MQDKYCIIMAGGVGSRFWPMSTTGMPKQFLDILGTGKSMLRMTFERFQEHCQDENIWVVTNKEHKKIVLEQLPEMKSHQVLSEPFRRNTAPCIAYASYKVWIKNPNAKMIISPADHQISDTKEFYNIIEKGFKFVSESSNLLTLGIQPSRPETEYGYIQFEKNDLSDDIKKVRTFTEKPGLKMAKTFVKSGEFLWNSGIFMWSVSAICNAFKQYLPDIHNLFRKGKAFYNTPKEGKFIKDIYEVCPIISVDYGIMEKAKNVYVLKADFGWSDVGTWNSLYMQSLKDESQNVSTGVKVKFYDAEKCIVKSTENKLVVVEGMQDYIIIDTKKALLICRKKNENKIRQFINDINLEYGDDYI